jgi:hypothetical protein
MESFLEDMMSGSYSGKGFVKDKEGSRTTCSIQMGNKCKRIEARNFSSIQPRCRTAIQVWEK